MSKQVDFLEKHSWDGDFYANKAERWLFENLVPVWRGNNIEEQYVHLAGSRSMPCVLNLHLQHLSALQHNE